MPLVWSGVSWSKFKELVVYQRSCKQLWRMREGRRKAEGAKQLINCCMLVCDYRPLVLRCSYHLTVFFFMFSLTQVAGQLPTINYTFEEAAAVTSHHTPLTNCSARHFHSIVRPLRRNHSSTQRTQRRRLCCSVSQSTCLLRQSPRSHAVSVRITFLCSISKCTRYLSGRAALHHCSLLLSCRSPTPFPPCLIG